MVKVRILQSLSRPFPDSQQEGIANILVGSERSLSDHYCQYVIADFFVYSVNGESYSRIFSVEELDVPDDGYSIIVSSIFEDKRRLDEILKSNGFNSVTSRTSWPRDKFVRRGNLYVKGSVNRDLATGGKFVFGEDFGFYSSSYKNNYYLLDAGIIPEGWRINRDETAFQSKLEYLLKIDKEFSETLEDLYGCPMYSLVGRYANAQNEGDHIDLTIMVLPKSKVIIIDKLRHQTYGRLERLEEIADKHGHKLIVLDTKKERIYFPLNCLVLEKNDEDFVIANSDTKGILKVLKSLGVNYETVKSNVSPHSGGSIRCRTNEMHSKKIFLGDYSLCFE